MMFESDRTPIVFLAFANSKKEGYLSQLILESKEIYDLLLPLKKEGQIDLLREHHTDHETIPSRLVDFKSRIAIFHYGGHADGQHLFFEDQAGHSTGLAELLGLLDALQLVFLNGCETLDHARLYLDSGVPIVIATTQVISDQDARYFAFCFYRALAKRWSVQDAFTAATAAVKLRAGGLFPNEEETVYYRGIGFTKSSNLKLPWRMFVNEGAEEKMAWKLPEGGFSKQRVAVILEGAESYQKIINGITSLQTKLKEKEAQMQAFQEPVPKELRQVLESIRTEQMQIENELEEEKNKEKQFREEVLRLANLFSKIEVSTEKLNLARSYFEAGKFREADAILRYDEMVTEKKQLLESKLQKERELQDINASLKAKAQEFLIKARLTLSLKEEKENWLEEVFKFFKDSIQSYAFFENTMAFANFLQKHNYFKKSLGLYRQALELASSDEEKANVLNNSANLHRLNNDFDRAEEDFQQAVKIYKSLSKKDPLIFMPSVAIGLHNLAILDKTRNKIELAFSGFREVKQIYTTLEKVQPGSFKSQMANVLNNLANLHAQRFQHSEAQQLYHQALLIYNELAEVNPNRFLADVALALNNKANSYKAMSKFKEAELDYSRALTIRRELAQVNPRAYLPAVAITLSDFANCKRIQSKTTEAQEAFEEALVIYRQLVHYDAGPFSADLALTLNNIAILHFDSQDFQSAADFSEEALKIYQRLSQANPEAFGPDLAMTLNNLGNIYQAQTKFDIAQQNFEEAIRLYKSLTNEEAQTLLPKLADVYNNLGLLSAAMNEHDKARKSIDEAIDIYRLVVEKKSPFFVQDLVTTLLNSANLFRLTTNQDRVSSLEQTREAITLIDLLSEETPIAQKNLAKAIQLLKLWGIDSEDKIESFLKDS